MQKRASSLHTRARELGGYEAAGTGAVRFVI